MGRPSKLIVAELVAAVVVDQSAVRCNNYCTDLLEVRQVMIAAVETSERSIGWC